MKRTAVVTFILALIFGFALISTVMSQDEDPFAGLDMGDNQQVTGDNSGMPMDDPLAGMDAGMGADAGGSADILFPDDPSGGAPADGGDMSLPGETGGMLPGEGDAGLPGMGGDDAMFPGDAPAAGGAEPELDIMAEPKPKPVKKSPPRTDKAVTKTDDIYTKSSYIGGYRNMKDFMTWGVKATSKLSAEYDASMLNDNIVDSAWIEAKKDGGKKQAITFSFDEKHFIGLYEKKYSKARINKIRVLNGYATDKETWKKYYRVKKMKVTKNNKLQFYFMLRDTMNWQTVTLKKPMIINPGDVVKAEIVDVYPDARREDESYTAITEIAFIGDPYGAKKEPKYVPEHLAGME